LAALDAPGDRPRGARDLLASAVAHREHDRHAGVALRSLDGGAERLAYRRGELPEAPDRAQADLVLHHLAELAREVAPQERHQAVDLAQRARPVLGRERVQR